MRSLAAARTAPDGGADRDRTGDPLLAKQVLSQLSYSPVASLGHRTAQLRVPLAPSAQRLRGMRVAPRAPPGYYSPASTRAALGRIPKPTGSERFFWSGVLCGRPAALGSLKRR